MKCPPLAPEAFEVVARLLTTDVDSEFRLFSSRPAATKAILQNVIRELGFGTIYVSPALKSLERRGSASTGCSDTTDRALDHHRTLRHHHTHDCRPQKGIGRRFAREPLLDKHVAFDIRVEEILNRPGS